jgi:hypothetical protein
VARKLEEIALYAALRALAPGAYMNPGIEAIEDQARRLGVPEKRAFCWVEKWCCKGWWDYGVSLRGGWFTPEAPPSLGERGWQGSSDGSPSRGGSRR